MATVTRNRSKSTRGVVARIQPDMPTLLSRLMEHGEIRMVNFHSGEVLTVDDYVRRRDARKAVQK